MFLKQTQLVLLLILITGARALVPLHDQRFGLGIWPADIHPLFTPLGYYAPLYQRSNERNGISKIVNNQDEFKIYLDVQHFKPEDIEVSVTDDFIQVAGRHEERKDPHGFISRQFVRRYAIPESIEPDFMFYEITPDGILIISAPKENSAQQKQQNVAPATQTNIAPVLEQTKEDNVTAEQETAETPTNEVNQKP